jgi:hypothetical protein
MYSERSRECAALRQVEVSFELVLVLSGHGHYRHLEIRVKTHDSGVRQIHPALFRATLPTNDGNGSGIPGCSQEVAELRENQPEALLGRGANPAHCGQPPCIGFAVSIEARSNVMRLRAMFNGSARQTAAVEITGETMPANGRRQIGHTETVGMAWSLFFHQ